MNYTQDWVHHDDIVAGWEKYLVPLAGLELHMLEVGSFEGRSAVWFFEHVLTNRDSYLVCVDTFEGDDQQREMGVDTVGIKRRFDENLKPFQDRLTTYIGQSEGFLKWFSADEDLKFNLIYIDGSHYQVDVLRDLVLAFDLLKPGGLLIADDYRMVWEGNIPAIAIDAFLNVYRAKIGVLHTGWQVICKKLSS